MVSCIISLWFPLLVAAGVPFPSGGVLCVGRSCCGGWDVHPSLPVQQVVEHSFLDHPGVEQTHHSLGTAPAWQKTCEWTQSCIAPQLAQQTLWWNSHSMKTKAVCPCLRYRPSQEQVRCRQVRGAARACALWTDTSASAVFYSHACLSCWFTLARQVHRPPASKASVYSSESSKSVSCTSTGGNWKLKNGNALYCIFFSWSFVEYQINSFASLVSYLKSWLKSTSIRCALRAQVFTWSFPPPQFLKTLWIQTA